MFKSGIKVYKKARAALMSSTFEAGAYLYNNGEKDLAEEYFRKTIRDTKDQEEKCSAHLYMAALAYQERDIAKTRNHLEATQESNRPLTEMRIATLNIMQKKFHDKNQKTGYIITSQEAKLLEDQMDALTHLGGDRFKRLNQEILAETHQELGRYYLDAYFNEKERKQPSLAPIAIENIKRAENHCKQAFASKHLDPDERADAGEMLATITKMQKPSDFDETYNILRQAREIPGVSPEAKADTTYLLVMFIDTNRGQAGKTAEFLPDYLNEVITNHTNDTEINEARLLLSLEKYRKHYTKEAPESLSHRIMKELADLGKEGSNKIKKDAYSIASVIKVEHKKYFIAENLLQNAFNIDTGLDYKEDSAIIGALMHINTNDGNVSSSIQYALQFINKHHTAPKKILEQIKVIESLNPDFEGLTKTIEGFSNDLAKQSNALKVQDDKTVKLPENTFQQIVDKFSSGFEAVSKISSCNDKQLTETLALIQKEKSAGK